MKSKRKFGLFFTVCIMVNICMASLHVGCSPQSSEPPLLEYPPDEGNQPGTDPDPDPGIDPGEDEPDSEITFTGVRPRNALITDEVIARGKAWDTGNEAWYVEAEKRIERDRKGDMKIGVADATGKPLAGVQVKVEMTNHEFGFGGSLDPSNIIDNDSRKQQILDMFNLAVFGNNMKWRNDAQNVKVTEPVLDWLIDNGITVRAHALFWMAWKNLPDGFEAKYANDGPGLKQEMENRLNYWVPYWGDRVVEWDVFNEPFAAEVRNGLKLVAGGENNINALIEEYIRKVKAIQPGMKTYINDFGLLTGTENKKNNFTAMINYLKANNAPIDGIGMQLYPTGKLNMANIISRFQHWETFGLELRLTEYAYIQADPQPSDAVKARDSFDILVACFSTKACKGFIWWGPFGSVISNNNGLTDVGACFAYLLYEKWWTNTQGTTDEAGAFATRAFYGDYKITVTANGKTKTVPVRFLTGGKTNFEISMD